jgi:hypothetical protein
MFRAETKPLEVRDKTPKPTYALHPRGAVDHICGSFVKASSIIRKSRLDKDDFKDRNFCKCATERG